MCEDCGTGWPDQTAEEIAKLKSRVAEMTERVASLDARIQTMVPWEPRNGCPTVEQVNAWNDVPDTAWLVGLDLLRLYTDAGVIEVWQYHQRSLSHEWPWYAVVPVRDGRPVSWSEVDGAVAEMAKNK